MDISDTPRTNSVVRTSVGLFLGGLYVDANVAREFEREINALLTEKETLKSALRCVVDSLAPTMSFWGEDLPSSLSIGYARGTALRALEELAND